MTLKKEVKSFSFEVKAYDEDDEYFTFEGYASTFGNVDYGDDVIVKGAFIESLKENSQVPILWQHQMSNPIGVSTQLMEDDNGLFIKGRLPREDRDVSGKVIPQMKVGSIREMSIGFFTEESDVIDSIRYIKKIMLYEVSLVTKAMNNKAKVGSFKSFESLKQIEQSLKECGLSKNEAKALISKVKEFSNQRDAEEIKKQRDAELKASMLASINNLIKDIKEFK